MKTIRKLGIAIESHNLCPGNQNVIARYGVRTRKRIASHRVKKKSWHTNRAGKLITVTMRIRAAIIISRGYHNDKTAKVHTGFFFVESMNHCELLD